MDTFGATFDGALTTIQSWLEWHERLNAPALYIPYELIEQQPRRAILCIQRYINGKIDRTSAARLRAAYSKAAVKAKCDALAEGAETINIGFSYYDSNTFFHRRHVSTIMPRSADASLSAEQIDVIRLRLSDLYPGSLKQVI